MNLRSTPRRVTASLAAASLIVLGACNGSDAEPSESGATSEVADEASGPVTAEDLADGSDGSGSAVDDQTSASGDDAGGDDAANSDDATATAANEGATQEPATEPVEGPVEEPTDEPVEEPDADVTGSAGDETATDAAPGTADADGRIAVVEVGAIRYDLGARPDITIGCGFVDGVGGFLFGQSATDTTFGIDTLVSTAAEADDPHILVIDEENDVAWQAGPIPSSVYADAGAGGIDTLQVDGRRVTGTATFVDPRTDRTATRSGRFEFVCPAGG